MKAKEKPKKKKKRSSKIPLIIILILFIILLLLLSQLITIWVGTNPEIPSEPLRQFPTLAPPPEITATLVPCDVNLAFQPVEANDDWTPCEKEFNGVPMMLVPIGCYLNRGNDNGTALEVCYDNPFWIDKYEVMNKAFKNLTCVYWSTSPDQPYVCIERWDAVKHCQSREANLPTEEQWEYAASGVDNWQYPWGDTWNSGNVHWNIQTTNKAEDVHSRPSGASWVGALHMSGNVWEWVQSTSAFAIARGGSFDSHSPELLTTYYRIRHGSYSGNGTGFRCVREITMSDSG